MSTSLYALDDNIKVYVLTVGILHRSFETSNLPMACSGGARPQNLRGGGGAFEGQTHILARQDIIFKKVPLFAHAFVTGLPPQEIRPLSK